MIKWKPITYEKLLLYPGSDLGNFKTLVIYDIIYIFIFNEKGLYAYKLDCTCKATHGNIFIYYITKINFSNEINLHASERKLHGILEIYQSKPMV